ncbi:Cyclin-like F-box [Penicillium digitatum]|uniref:Cyclin-like F-box n=1 Tax=Penicillium digitatum TaxID=36651 RepID=A0A7T6XLY6_PENDI|nr:Cyclin-like F-box [Penicillium digitatum]
MEFIEAGADTNPFDKLLETTLFTALANGLLEPARLMLEKNAKLPLGKYTGGRELLAAILTREIGIIRTLIYRGVSTEQAENAYTSPLICAVRTGSLEIVKLVYKEGSNPPSLTYNPGRLVLAFGLRHSACFWKPRDRGLPGGLHGPLQQ